MLAHILLCIVDIPELRPLVLGIPLAEFIPVREDPFLGAGFSSSRRAPPMAASNFPAARVSSSVTVCSLLRLAL
jgi:hypothetical protein